MKWTKERCQEEAIKYIFRGEFKNKSRGAYDKSQKNGWLDEICSHMTFKNKSSDYWTKERCYEESLKYNNKKDFRNKSRNAYEISQKNGWLDEITIHISKRNINGYWTKEKCQEEALKYNKRIDFKENCSAAHTISIKNNWLDEICSHMKQLKCENGYWTKERCQEEALKYDNKKDFRNKSYSAYKSSYYNNWLDEFCSHMKQLGNTYKRCIYVYEFNDNHAYVGLTYNINDRKFEHLNREKSAVNKHIKICSDYTFKQLTEYIDVDNASKLEGEYVEKYKNNGWIILNKIKTGGVGGNTLIWTKERCKEESLKYDNKKDFRKNSGTAYAVSIKNKWMEIFSHMVEKKNKNGYWTKEKCLEESLKYDTRSSFQKGCGVAYKKCRINKWLDEIFI